MIINIHIDTALQFLRLSSRQTGMVGRELEVLHSHRTELVREVAKSLLKQYTSSNESLMSGTANNSTNVSHMNCYLKLSYPAAEAYLSKLPVKADDDFAYVLQQYLVHDRMQVIRGIREHGDVKLDQAVIYIAEFEKEIFFPLCDIILQSCL